MAKSAAKGSLPHGWQVKTSKKYPNRIYYFNIFTGSSTWECPELDPPEEVLKEVKEQKTSSKLCSQFVQRKKNLIKPQSNPKHESTFQRKNAGNPSSANDVSSKSSGVPTAIVGPVIHKQVKFNISSKPKLLPSKGFEVKTRDTQKMKRKAGHLDDTDAIVKNVESIGKKKRNRGRRKTKKIHPLNISNEKKRTSEDDEVKISEEPSNKSRRLSVEVKIPEKCSSASVPIENKDIEDIEMLDVSMDIIEDLTAKTETVIVTVASYYIVVDTNVLISELNLVNELKDTPMNGCGPPHIFIPWIVIEELDKLKSNRSNKNISRSVCEAIRYLNSVLSKHPRFHGQSPAEAEEWAKTYSKCNDDKILECCMALGSKMPKEKVILLTNDKNLVNKALILHINVHNFESMMECVKPDTTFNFSEYTDNKSGKRRRKSGGMNNGSTNEATTVSQDQQKISQECNDYKLGSTNEVTTAAGQDEQKILQERNDYKREIHTIMCTARQLLKNNLSRFLEFEMHEAYGSTWLSFPVQRNVLNGVLAAILKYWRMVFSTFMTEKDKRNFELLHETVSRPEGFLADDKEECLVILSSVEDVFLSIKRRSPNIKVPLEKIQEFRVAIVDAFYVYNEVESTIKQAEQESTLALFERDWVFINQLCGMVLDSCGVPHDIQYDRPNQMLTDIQVRQLMCDFYPGLKQLKTQMFIMHTAVKECRPAKNIFKNLSQSLLKFIPSMNLPFQPFTHPHFSPRALERFCTNSQNRKMIEIGCKQIEKFFSKLDEALVALMSSNSKKTSMSPETMICD